MWLIYILALIGIVTVARYLITVIPLVFDRTSNGRIYGQRKYWSGN